MRETPGKRRRGARRLAALFPLVLLDCGGYASAPRALLLVTVDTLRADWLGAYGSELGLTPRLDALAEQSLVFDSAYAPTPLTFPSLATLLTGRYPPELGIRTNLSAIPEQVPTLASVLREHGWGTAAVVSNFVLREKPGLAEHFDLYDDTMRDAEAVRGWPERTAGATTDAALAALEALAAPGSRVPWLLWVHYQDPHGPYTPPAGWRERHLERARRAPDGDRELRGEPDDYGAGAIPRYQLLDDRRDVAFYRAGYAAEIAYTDAEIGRLLDEVERRGALEHTAVLFAADHGESLGERGWWFAHGQHLTDELVRVPLLLRVPGHAPARREDVVSLADVYPTLLELLVGASPAADYAGRNLLAAAASARQSAPFLTTLSGYPEPRVGIVEDGYKLILTWRDERWRAELFRLGHEDVDLTAPAPQVASRMRERLQELRDRYDRDVEERRHTLELDDLEKLRALGYALDPEP